MRLRGSLHVEHTLARRGAEKLWQLVHVRALRQRPGRADRQPGRADGRGRACRRSTLSGWQVAADANIAGQMYPDQSLYPADSVPNVVRRINNALRRADQVQHVEGRGDRDYFLPIVADAEAGFGGPLNAFELMKGMIEAGAAGVHFEDQLASEKKCGHMGGKVLVPTSAVRPHADRRAAGRRRAGRADGARGPHRRRQRANCSPATSTSATAASSPASARAEGFYRIEGGLDMAIDRGLVVRALRRPAVVRDVAARPGRGAALRRGDPRRVSRQAAGLQLLAVVQLEEEARRRDDRPLPARAGRDGLQVPVHHAGRLPRLEPVDVRAGPRLSREGMTAYAALQEREFAREADAGYRATKHQRFVGTGYFDEVAQTIACGYSSTTALAGSTEEAQFETQPAA